MTTGKPRRVATREEVEASVAKLLDVLRACDGYGYDPYDARIGAIYKWAYGLRRRHPLGALVLNALYGIELVAPITFRRLRGIAPTWDPMGNSYRAGSHLALAHHAHKSFHQNSAETILDDVVRRLVGEPGCRGFALGFVCLTGSNQEWRTDVPVAHYTVRVARALLRHERSVNSGRYRSVLEENVRFLTEGLDWVEHDGCVGVGYTPADPLQVVNIWADVAAFLAAYDSHFGLTVHRDRVKALTKSILSHQSPDGTWPYFARWEKLQSGVDSCHTAMVLGGLADIALSCPDILPLEIRSALDSGTSRWLDLFFDQASGRYWNQPETPQHSYSACLGDLLYAAIRISRPELGLRQSLIERVKLIADNAVSWTLDNHRLSDGRFCERRIGHWKYAVRGVRSFDGAIADSMALYLGWRYYDQAHLIWVV